MMPLTEAAVAMQGELLGADRPFEGVSTDTRTIASGELFFALKGERFDAARFLDQAFARGAAGVVIGREAIAGGATVHPAIVVDDARAALGRLAASWRQRFTLPLVGLTGSNGKTTVKEMIAAVLRSDCADADSVLATEGNLNNDIGVPLTLLRLRERHRYAVIEMGMNHAGEIHYLTGLARPHVALVTNAGCAHIGLLGSLDAIARAKGEIYEGLGSQDIAVINADDGYAPMWRAQNSGRVIVEFGLDKPAAVSGRYTGHAMHSEIVLSTRSAEAAFTLQAPGVHNVRNALAAAAAGIALDIPVASIAEGLARFRGAKGRMQRLPGLNSAVVIDDSYNANPDSTLAAISALAAMPGKRVLVLGDMGELGPEGPAQHARMGQAAREAGIERLFTFGELTQRTCECFGPGCRHYTRIEDLLAAIELELDAATTLLVKGSRFMQMERVVHSFAVGQS
jgi:UDP-N-acetylmuramoyl-tripeptide--D-alanyl-D-alanine ligase